MSLLSLEELQKQKTPYLAEEIEGNTVLKMWVRGVPVEDEARKQLLNVASLPIIFKHVAAMPDVHVGKGATIGSVIPTVNAIIPAAVGMDIGCGMMASRTALRIQHLPHNRAPLRRAIENGIPHGRDPGPRDPGAWNTPPSAVDQAWAQLKTEFEALCEAYPRLKNTNNYKHLGTLGTGNHFIEVCVDEEDFVWVMLHSGSRGVGNAIGTLFCNLAKEEALRNQIQLPDINLAYFEEGTTYFNDYVRAVHWAQKFAQLNRELMMQRVLDAIAKTLDYSIELQGLNINCHHNYVQKEHHFGQDVYVTRKGAVSAKVGEMGIIPGSMGARSFIVRGKGNPESFTSCSHGAGRIMSRTAAKKAFTLEDHEADTQGIECRKDAAIIDETPKAYKDIDAVMRAQADLVEIVHTLKQVVCVKG